MNDYSPFQKRCMDFIHRYLEEIRVLATKPKEFFHLHRDEIGFLEPTLFASVNILIPVLFYSLFVAPFTFGLALLFVLPALVYGLGLIFVSAIILHGLVRLLGGQEKLEVTYKSLAYSSAAAYSWLIPVPFVNLLLFTALFCILLYFALREIHELTPQQAGLLLAVPGFLILITGAILTLIILWLALKGLGFILALAFSS